MTRDKETQRKETPDTEAFEKMKEFTRRLVAVPKSELPTPKRKIKQRPAK